MPTRYQVDLDANREFARLDALVSRRRKRHTVAALIGASLPIIVLVVLYLCTGPTP